MATQTLPTRVYEGVTYYRYLLSFRLADGTRKRLTHWSPGRPWLHGEVARRLTETFGLEQIKPKSLTISGPR